MNRSRAFTIVELLIVIVVIAILAAIALVSYNSIMSQAKDSSLKSDLNTYGKQIQLEKVKSGTFPSVAQVTGANGIITPKDGISYVYTTSMNAYCLSAANTSSDTAFNITESGVIQEGLCGPSALYLQSLTQANCPADRTVAVDARDNRTYWVQRLADGKCWMLTNLAYEGGGSNAYGDVLAVQNGTSDPTPLSYTEPKYYTLPDSNPTVNPAEPSVNTAGGGTAAGGERQYGYLYNWCAAMGAQSQACQASLGSGFTNASICPANWQLPTGSTSGDFTALNQAINSNSTSTDEGLRTHWLAQRSGFRSGASAVNQGMEAYYWSSTQSSGSMTRQMYLSGSSVNASATIYNKNAGFAVRCVAS